MPVWIGFLASLLSPLSYFLIFYRWPVTRDFPWTSYLLFALGIGLVAVGLRRAFREPERYRGKIAGSVLGALSLALLGLFAYGTAYGSKGLPPSKGAPQVGAQAPDFTLPDTNGNAVTLSRLLAQPDARNGAVLIFYRGYW